MITDLPECGSVSCCHVLLSSFLSLRQFVSVEEHVGRVLEKVPGLVAACKSFTQEAQEVNAK